MAARPAHLVRLQALQDKGWLLLAGPFPAVWMPLTRLRRALPASLIVAEFASLQAAQEWAEADPCRPVCCHRRIQGNYRTAIQEWYYPPKRAMAAITYHVSSQHSLPEKILWYISRRES